MFIVGNATLDKILSEIFYLSEYLNMSGEYVEGLTIFEREYFVYKLIAKLKEEAEAKEQQNG